MVSLFDLTGTSQRERQAVNKARRNLTSNPRPETIRPIDIPTGADRIRIKDRWRLNSGTILTHHSQEYEALVIGKKEIVVNKRGHERKVTLPPHKKRMTDGNVRIKLPLYLFPGEYVSCPVCGKDMTDVFYEPRNQAMKKCSHSCHRINTGLAGQIANEFGL